MDVSLDPRASRLLALMHEAAEPVTLDELAVAGVDDPATALHALELAGFTVERVIDRTARREFECLRLAPSAPASPAAAHEPAAARPAPTPAPAAATDPAPSSPSSSRAAGLLAAADRRPVVLALAALVVAVLLGRAVAGRRG